MFENLSIFDKVKAYEDKTCVCQFLGNPVPS